MVRITEIRVCDFSSYTIPIREDTNRGEGLS
jgi:hypothetical protein